MSFLDALIIEADKALKTLTPSVSKAERPSPSEAHEDSPLTIEDHLKVTGLMRVNHCGEVCAQALYRSQALTSGSPGVKASMQEAAQEEIDHLAWCEQRLAELNSRPSLLNPVFYGLSFGIGAMAGLVGDRYNLGFVAETEEQVCKHLEQHLSQLPKDDLRTQAILEQMHVDEAKHQKEALAQGGVEFPMPVKLLMGAVAKVMTSTTYRI
ncbi:MAG: 2-polyprenyl-3-methyl-6-methoxy-1,4-benzoquinone monooxygenase [Pseudomonadota bacterium]|nr:2-polyprenyl-3-methyl-6-methoxy-1,4-benzoquinone monooxygenase [Pseudomonadota bacterium]